MSDAGNLADLVVRAARESPDRVALVEAGTGRRTTWAELDAEVDRVAAGLAAMGLVAGYRVVIVVGNRLEFVTTYLGALRARLVAVPVNPRAATGELVRMVADCGARVVVGDATTITSVRAAVAGLQDALEGAEEELRSRTPVPRIVVCGALPVPGRDRLRRPRRRWGAARRRGRGHRPRVARGAALHQRDVRPAPRRDAQPPGPARQHRAGLGRRAADGAARRRRCSGCSRCSTSTGSTPCSGRSCGSARAWSWSTASTSRAPSTWSRTRR